MVRSLCNGALALLVVCSCPPHAALAQSAGRAPKGQLLQSRVTKGTKIAVVVDGPAEFYDQATGKLAKEIRVLLAGRYGQWEVPTKPNFVGNFTSKGAREQLAKALRDPEIGLIIGLGTNVASAVGAAQFEFPKPVLLPFAAPRLQRLPNDKGTSGKHNLAYLSGIVDIKREIEAFVDLTKAKEVVLLVDAHYLTRPNKTKKALQALVGDSAKVRVVASGKDAAETLNKIPEGTKALYVGPLLRMPSSQHAALVRGLNERNIATYASEGRAWVEMGALMTLVPDDDMQRRLRKLALYVDSTISGEEPSTFSTDYASRSVLLLNLQTAQKIGVHPTYAQLTDAEIVGETGQRAGGPRLELQDAIARALEANLDLSAARVDADIAKRSTQEAEAALYPTAALEAKYVQVLPESKAMLSFARTASWGGSVNIPLYSAMAWANRKSKMTAEQATDRGIYTKALDVVAQTATAYVNVLRARNAEAINRQNLARIRRNLEMAKVRVELGAAGRQELFRWQIEIADGKANLIRAQAVRNQSDIQLNRLINRPLETPVSVGEPASDHLGLVVDPRVQPYVQDPFSFRIFREFMVKESVANAPEIQQLDANISSVQQMREGQKRDLWIPNVFATISVNHNFYMDGAPAAFTMPRGGDSGAGSGGQAGQGGAAGQPAGQAGAGGGEEAPSFEFPNSPIWNVGVGLSWTAFDFRRNRRIQQTDSRLVQMQRQRAALVQGIEQRVRSAMHQAGASGGVVELRDRAAKAAGENFELVTDAYQKGTVGIITLVDAQNQALQTELAAANALYDWLLDFIEVQRASGVFTFLESTQDQDKFATRLQSFFSAHQGKSRR